MKYLRQGRSVPGHALTRLLKFSPQQFRELPPTDQFHRPLSNHQRTPHRIQRYPPISDAIDRSALSDVRSRWPLKNISVSLRRLLRYFLSQQLEVWARRHSVRGHQLKLERTPRIRSH